MERITYTNGFLCGDGWEQALCDELTSLKPGEKFFSPAPGLVMGGTGRAKIKTEPVFARQWLPECVELAGDSIAELVQVMGPVVDSYLDQTSLPWTFVCHTPDAFTEDSERYIKTGARTTLLQEKFLERMTKFRKRAMERFEDWNRINEKRPCIVIQVVMTDASRLWLSIVERFKTRNGRYVPHLWRKNPGMVEHDDQAPCRSYYKLEEAWIQSGIFPRKNEVCVDLGAAPGGWTWAALKRGARVVAVDAAELKKHVENHPRCEHSIDNGYAFMPPKQVDWMFCDMIVKPMATMGLLERWLESKACKKFVVNIKFRGKDPSTILASVEELRVKFQIPFLVVRHLYFDRNEITLIGSMTDKFR